MRRANSNTQYGETKRCRGEGREEEEEGAAAACLPQSHHKSLYGRIICHKLISMHVRDGLTETTRRCRVGGKVAGAGMWRFGGTSGPPLSGPPPPPPPSPPPPPPLLVPLAVKVRGQGGPPASSSSRPYSRPSMEETHQDVLLLFFSIHPSFLPAFLPSSHPTLPLSHWPWGKQEFA